MQTFKHCSVAKRERGESCHLEMLWKIQLQLDFKRGFVALLNFIAPGSTWNLVGDLAGSKGIAFSLEGDL